MDCTGEKNCVVPFGIGSCVQNPSIHDVELACTRVLPALRAHEGLSRNSRGICELRCSCFQVLPSCFASSSFITAADHFLTATVFFLGGLVSLDQIRPLLAVNFLSRRGRWLRPPPPFFFADLICLNWVINSRTLSRIFLRETVFADFSFPTTERSVCRRLSQWKSSQLERVFLWHAESF